MSVFPGSMEICISSPTSGRPRKKRVGITLTQPLTQESKKVETETAVPKIAILLQETLIFFKDLSRLCYNTISLSKLALASVPWGT